MYKSFHKLKYILLTIVICLVSITILPASSKPDKKPIFRIIAFHFAAFSLTASEFPQNWDWYHNQFLGCGEYNGNTWRPTSAVLHLENREHPAIRNLPETFVASPNEWYKWEKDLRTNPDIKILLSIRYRLRE
jgi:hypothetical protein